MPLNPTRVFHVNVNCTNLEASRRWYTTTLGLHELVRTTPTRPQPGGAFGLEAVQWDAWILGGDEPSDTPALDLLEWIVPRPTGPPPSPATAGFGEITISVPAPAAIGATSADSTADGDDILLVDPDGTRLRVTASETTSVCGLQVGASDLVASTAWYTDVVGLDRVGEHHVGTGERFTFEIVASRGEHAPRAANQLGVFRAAFLTDDIERDHRHLTEAGATCLSPPTTLDMGPGLPGDLPTLFFLDPDGACLELIQA